VGPRAGPGDRGDGGRHVRTRRRLGVPFSVGAAGTTGLTVGGIGRRPVLVDGRLEEHEYVCLTLSFDHDLIDGAPATRFAAELSRLIECGDGLAATLLHSGR
jgi:hypothetical protein